MSGYKLVPTSNVTPDTDWLESPGSFNELPTPFHEITGSEFVAQSIYTPQAVEHRQVVLPNEDRKTHPTRDTWIMWYAHCGLAVLPPVKWRLNQDDRIEYSDSPLFYYLGCNHQYRELSIRECRERNISHFGSCWHVHECTECGFIRSVDSS